MRTSSSVGGGDDVSGDGDVAAAGEDDGAAVQAGRAGDDVEACSVRGVFAAGVGVDGGAVC